jgi:hypothetical protein
VGASAHFAPRRHLSRVTAVKIALEVRSGDSWCVLPAVPSVSLAGSILESKQTHRTAVQPMVFWLVRSTQLWLACKVILRILSTMNLLCVYFRIARNAVHHSYVLMLSGAKLYGTIRLQGGVGIDDAHFSLSLRPHNVGAFAFRKVVDISLES